MKSPTLKFSEIKKMGNFCIFFTVNPEDIDLDFKMFVVDESFSQQTLKQELKEIESRPNFISFMQEIEYD
jgi:hypothetical protein